MNVLNINGGTRYKVGKSEVTQLVLRCFLKDGTDWLLHMWKERHHAPEVWSIMAGRV